MATPDVNQIRWVIDEKRLQKITPITKTVHNIVSTPINKVFQGVTIIHGSLVQFFQNNASIMKPIIQTAFVTWFLHEAYVWLFVYPEFKAADNQEKELQYQAEHQEELSPFIKIADCGDQETTIPEYLTKSYEKYPHFLSQSREEYNENYTNYWTERIMQQQMFQRLQLQEQQDREQQMEEAYNALGRPKPRKLRKLLRLYDEALEQEHQKQEDIAYNKLVDYSRKYQDPGENGNGKQQFGQQRLGQSQGSSQGSSSQGQKSRIR